MMLVSSKAWSPQGIDGLEPSAWEALRQNARSVCVIAGAGAGKTEFLAQKATYLLQTGLCAAPKRILAISFKRDAARNLAERVQKRCPPEQARRFDSLTFDAFTKSLLDRFRVAVPEPYSPAPNYQIVFPLRQQLEDFLIRHGFRGITTTTLEREIVRTPLPVNRVNDEAKRAVYLYWDEYIKNKRSFLTFAMINRLAEWLLRENPYVRRALQVTYPFVFLDEFQDTTYPQYELLKTAFKDSDTIFTAVGDDKQRIMGWAGAMPDAFDRFETDFNAQRITLVSNWRSHKDLVRIQHVIAQHIDPNAEPPLARAERSVDGDISAIWEYPTSKGEASDLAAWIAGEINDGIAPHEIAILVRLRANEAEDQLVPYLSQYEIKLRNVARSVGSIAIQDLLGEELVGILLPLLRLGATATNATAWSSAWRNLMLLERIYPDDLMKQEHLHRRLERFARQLRSEMQHSKPAEETARTISQWILEFVDPAALRRAIPTYQRQRDFDRVWEGFVKLLVESTENAVNWTEVLDLFEGFGQVPLMTIHKSKGLEFHTMIFYGLDSQKWWSLTPDRPEELNSFFVAFTRAKQRAFFTLSRDRGKPIVWIEQILASAGVRVVDRTARRK